MTYLPVLIGFSALFSLFAAEILGVKASFLAAAVCFAASAFLLILRRTRKPAVYSTVLACMAIFFVYYAAATLETVVPLENYYNTNGHIEGVVSRLPEERNGKYTYVIKNVKIDDVKIRGKIRVSSEKSLGADIGDTVGADCFLFAGTNYYSKGIFLSAYIDGYNDTEIQKNNKIPPIYYPEYLRGKMIEAIKRYIPKEEAAFLCGIVTGSKNDISQKLTAQFRKLGLSHWMAVSGLHLSILSVVLSFILSKFKINRVFKAAVFACVLTAFAAITGFEASAVRSLIMHIIIIFSQLLYRKAEPINSLGIAVIINCLRSPYAASDIGFILSVFSTLGILTLGVKLNGFITAQIKQKGFTGKLLRSAAGGFSCSVSATVFLLPFSIYYFGMVSVISPITNLIFMLPFTALFALAGVITIFLYIPGFDIIARVISFAAAILTRAVLYLVSLFAKIPFANISVYSRYIKIWLLTALIFAAVAVLINKKQVSKALAAACAVVFVLAFFMEQISDKNSVQAVVTDCGSSLSVIVTDGKHTAVIGTDGYNTDETLGAMCICEVDGAVILNRSYKDYSGALSLCEEFGEGKLFFSDCYIDDLTERRAKEYKADGTAFISDGFRAEFFETKEADYAELKIGETSFLICSDSLKLSRLSGYYDYVITSKAPGNTGNLHFDKVIISCYDSSAETIAADFNGSANKYIATAGKGDIIIKVSGKKQSVRRGYNG